MDVLVRLDLHADHVLLAVGDPPFHFLFGKGQRIGHVETRRGVVLEIGDGFPFLLQLGGRVERDVGVSRFQKLGDMFLVNVAPLALAIGPVFAPEADALVEPDAQPREGLDDVGLRAGHESLRVGILDPQNEITAMLFSEQVVI